ncbi:folylpolyglutamate synthetase [Fusarium subglutinans]|uniref:Folylpolyglutamate synthase n=1 Tax=Gibberella subglutinans TaxID=42677 RepID=A0A8H5URG7_GIBSU|nr:folylpolyglutamate synthetase [Fusarium subglutinans]KAF5595458.1 folylpolyglutamate synthetase [Fusarium subglutinans]
MAARRGISTVSRDYNEALRLLSTLYSNRQATNLFDKSIASNSSSVPTKDPNALAIPEMREWLRRAGYEPKDLARLRHIHIAGTKGKGSVSAFATSMLREYEIVGTYTSPHLVSPRERIAIQGEPVSQSLFAAAFFDLWESLSEAAKKDGKSLTESEGPGSKPFFFRFMTLLAWHIFLSQKVDSVVLECGIGGEYDATNVVPPEAVSAAVITQLGIDHVAMLGDTVEKIAWHKAGILKPGVRGFVRRMDEKPGVMQVLRQRAAEKGAELVELDDARIELWGGVHGRLQGDFQKYNQALAVCAVRQHLGMSFEPKDFFKNIQRKMCVGLEHASLRGRCEIIQQGHIGWYLDGAHTTDSMYEVAKWFASNVETFESAILVFNQQERDATKLLTILLDTVQEFTGRTNIFSHAFFTRNDQERPSTDEEARDLSVQTRVAEMMAERAADCEVNTFDNIQDAVAEARKVAGVYHRVLATGSMYLVGGVLQVLEPEGLL